MLVRMGYQYWNLDRFRVCCSVQFGGAAVPRLTWMHENQPRETGCVCASCWHGRGDESNSLQMMKDLRCGDATRSTEDFIVLLGLSCVIDSQFFAFEVSGNRTLLLFCWKMKVMMTCRKAIIDLRIKYSWNNAQADESNGLTISLEGKVLYSRTVDDHSIQWLW